MLWRKSKTGDDTRLVIPDTLKSHILGLNHDIPSSGHQGMVRTKAKHICKYYWPGMGKDIESYVLSCEIQAK